MPLVPFAAFLTGALLSLLLPAGLLVALATWYWVFSARAPDASDGSGAAPTPAAVNLPQAPAAEGGPPAHEV